MNQYNILMTMILALGMVSIPMHGEVATSGDWQYDGTKIVKYLGNEVSVTVPSSINGQAIASIGEFAFKDSPNTLNITLSEGITTLDDYSLIGLNRLRTLTLPNSLKMVGNAVQNTMPIDNIYVHSLDAWLDIDYTGMSGLAQNTKLYIIEGVQPQKSVAVSEYTYSAYAPLKKYAFAGVCNLTKIDLSGCPEIPQGSFANCTGLTDVVYSDNLQTIGIGSFTSTKLHSIILPESVKTIGAYAFSDCVSVQQLWLGRNITNIGEGAFNGIAQNAVITSASKTPAAGGRGAFHSKVRTGCDLFVPEASVEAYKTSWGFTNVEGCADSDSEWVVSNGFITAYTGTSNNVNIPQYVGVDYVQGFTSDVFQGNINITSVVFPESMVFPENAFKGCTSLSNVILPADLVSIPSSAFEDCSSLLSISLPSGVREIGEYAFANSGLVDFAVPDSLVKFDKYAFDGCTIQRVNCRSLDQWQKINFGNPYANPGYNHARLFINGIELKLLDTYAIVINDYAFYGIASLEKVILNEAVSVGKNAFAQCPNIDFIGFSNNLTSVDRSAFDGSGTGQSLAFGSNIWSIGEFAFRKGDSSDNLKSLYFGPGLYVIEPWAFENHDEITDIYISRNKPPYLCSAREAEMNFDSAVFSDVVKDNALLHVPDGCEAEYAEKWEFKNVVGNSTGILTVKIPDSGNLSFINPTKGMRVRITPEDDEWEISTATLGDQDITSQIDSNGYYTLPTIEGDVTLSVVFKKKDDSGVETISKDKSPIKIVVSGDEVSVMGAANGSEVRVFNISGQLVTTSRNHTFQLSANGVMILAVEGTTFKFIK